MNNNDLQYLLNMINKMDKSQISEGVSKLNQILSPEEKQRLIDTLNSNNK